MNDGYVDRLRKGASLSSGIPPILENVGVGKIGRPTVRPYSETVARAKRRE